MKLPPIQSLNDLRRDALNKHMQEVRDHRKCPEGSLCRKILYAK